MDSVVKTIETAAGVEDDDPGEFLAVYECVYAGKPKPKKSPAEDDASSDADDDDADASSPSGPSTAAERMAKERFLPPHVGRISVYADAVHFKADMFGLDLTELRLMRWQVKRVDGGHKYAVTIVDWHGVAHDFQLHTLSGELYDRLVRTWHLEEMVTRKSSATNPHVQDPNDPNSKTGREAAEALARHKALIEARSKTAHGRLMRRIRPALREGRRACRLARGAYVETRDFLFPPPLPPPPPLPTVDVREKTSKCLFLSIVAADDLLAMDSGGVSDPFAVARWGALECKTEVVYKTVAPVWNETFVFHLGACPDIVDEDITLCLYDYDLALNDFLGFVRVPVKGKRLSDAKVWSPEPNWYAVEALPEGYGDSAGFDWGRLKDQMTFWEGKRQYTGRVKIATWIGERTDLTMRTAQHPVMWKPCEPSRDDAKFYVEPLTAALHVHVSRGRDILPMDGNRDDPGGLSDPYCEVILEHEKTRKMETEQTHYIDDVDAPEWERKFSFVVSRPYTANTLWFKVYDYDGGFDELIGQVQIKCEDLEIHEGMVKPPPARWHTLLDLEGNEKNADGDPYGEILVAAYIDEEYLEHMHLQKVRREDEVNLGTLEVDVFKLHELPEGAADVFVVMKYGPYWTRLPTRDPERGEASFDLRSLFPVIDLHVPVIIAAFAGEGDAPRLLGKIKVPAAALESNQRYFKMVDMGAVDASTGEVAMGGKLDIGLTYYRDSSEEATIALARQYVKPLCSDKWYYNPIPELEQEKVAKRHKELVIAQLAAGNPPVREHIAREILDFSRHEFNSRMIQTSIARLQCFAAEGMEIIAAVDDIFSWRNPYVTAFVQAVLFFMVNYPKLLLPGVLFLVGSIPLAMFPTRRKRALDQISMDYDVSVGKLPPRLEILLNGDSLTNEEIKKLEREAGERDAAETEAEKARRKAEEEEAARLKAEEEASAAEEAEAIAVILAEADAESEEDSDDDMAEAPKVAGSLNPFTNLTRQYEELTAMITSIQTTMDNVATVLEQIMGVLTWREPRLTFVVMCILMLSSVGIFFSQVVVELAVGIVRLYGGKATSAAKGAAASGMGEAAAAATAFATRVWDRYLEYPYEVAKFAVTTSMSQTLGALAYVWSLFTLAAIFRLCRFIASLYLLWTLRHPSILPDETAEFKSAGKRVEVDEKAEAERKAKREAEAAKEAETATNGEAPAPERKKSKAELEAEAERERRRVARAEKKEARRKQKEAEEAEKRKRASGASIILDPRPVAPVNAFSRIPSRQYRVL